jgi:agmatine/peptidylarginine deiminase
MLLGALLASMLHLHGHLHEHEGHKHSASDDPHVHGPIGITNRPTHPPGGDLTLSPEWEPASAVAVALPRLRMEDKAYLRTVTDLARAVLQVPGVQFLLLVEDQSFAALSIWKKQVGEANLDARRVRVLSLRELNSVWLRDYGPVFLRRTKPQGLMVLDFGYRDFRLPYDADGVSFVGGMPTLRPADDLVPLYFASHLNLPMVHPGFVLNGGDLYADGQGRVFTTNETLHLNAGDRDYVEGIFKQYCGVREVVFLRPLPGPVVKHLDMFFKLVAPSVCLLGEYEDVKGDDEIACLQREARQVLDENAELLAGKGMKVIRTPMPKIASLSRWDYYGRVLSDKEREHRATELAQASKVSLADMTAQLKKETVIVFRTFLNSIYLSNRPRESEDAKGVRLVIVPGYDAVVPPEVRTRVEAAYRQAYGEKIVLTFADAEGLAHSNGSLRCITVVIPAP